MSEGPLENTGTVNQGKRLRLSKGKQGYLKGRAGDAADVILSAVGYNLPLVLARLRIILRVILLALLQTFTIRPALKPAS